MPGQSEQYNLRAIRDLLLDAFNADELHDLFTFAETEELQAVPNEFAEGDGLPAKVRKAVTYCERHGLLGEMLAEVKAANRYAYEQYEATLGTPARAVSLGSLGRWPAWGVPAALAVIVVSVVVVLVLVLRGCGPAPVAPPTEQALLTGTPTPTQTETPEPSPEPTITPEAEREPQFVVVYGGSDGVTIRSGPGTDYPDVGTVYHGERLAVEGRPVSHQGVPWWPVLTANVQGWVAEWFGSTRLVKPFMEVGASVLVVNPAGSSEVDLWENCEIKHIVSWGTELVVIGAPDPSKCGDSDAAIKQTGREWWLVETPEGLQGWVVDFGIYDTTDWVKPVNIAPAWYLELHSHG